MSNERSLRDGFTSLTTELVLTTAAVTFTCLVGFEKSTQRWIFLGLAVTFMLLGTACRTLRQPQPAEYERLWTQQGNLLTRISGALGAIVGNRSSPDRETGVGRLLVILLQAAKDCGRTPELNRATFFELNDSTDGVKLVRREQIGREGQPSRGYQYKEGSWSQSVIEYVRDPENAAAVFYDVEKHPPEGMPRRAGRTYRSMAWAPVRAQQIPVGLLRVDSPNRKAFRQRDELILSSVAAAIGAGIACRACDIIRSPK
jgi:hypothetical protein